MDILTQQLINGLVLGSIYALVALGYTMVYGILELINFAHGEVTMFGAMICLAVIGAFAGSGADMHGAIIVLFGLLAATGGAHHRHRRLDRPAKPGDADLGQTIHQFSTAVAAGSL